MNFSILAAEFEADEHADTSNIKGYKCDSTHTNVRGAEVVAQKFYEAIVASDSILKAYTK